LAAGNKLRTGYPNVMVPGGILLLTLISTEIFGAERYLC
jgi:hypothetical protein